MTLQPPSATGQPLSAYLDQRRDQTSLRTFTREEQPPYDTIDHYHYGGFPSNRIPHRDFTQERRHFETLSNRPSQPKEIVIRPRPVRTFTSDQDRVQGKLCRLESDVYSAAKQAAARVVSGCKHFPERNILNPETREFVTCGKNMVNGAQQRSSEETTIEETFGRIHRLSENELHARNERGKHDAIEYSKDFYKMGACIPVVDMNSKGSKTGFGFQGLDLKSKLISEQLWRATRRNTQEIDARKLKNYKEVAAERELQYEQKLVSELPDVYVPPVPLYTPPPVELPPPESKKDKRARELKEKKEEKEREKERKLQLLHQKRLVTH